MTITEYEQPSFSRDALLRSIEHSDYSPPKKTIVSNTLAMIIPDLVVQAENDRDRADRYIWQAKQILGELDDAIRGFDRYRREPKDPNTADQMLWFHQKISKERSGKYSLSKELLEGAIRNYLSYEWHNDYIDWCIIDALAFMESEAFIGFARANKSISGGIDFFTCAILFGVMGGALLWLGVVKLPITDWPWWAWVLLALLAREVYAIVRKRRAVALSNGKILMAMYDAYRALDGNTISPARVREALQSAEEKGVVWPTIIWPVIDRVIARNAQLWHIWPQQRSLWI